LKDPSRKRDDFNDLLTGLNIATILHDLTRIIQFGKYNIRMIKINIPGGNTLQPDHLVCDVNGKLAVDGQVNDLTSN